MLFIRNVTFMSPDPRRLADFWSAALELPERVDKDNETIIADAGWNHPRLTFQLAPDLTVARSSVHLDVTVTITPPPSMG